MVICLERGADLHMAQLMPYCGPLTVSCFIKIRIGFYLTGTGSPGYSRKRAVKRVCVRACVRAYHCTRPPSLQKAGDQLHVSLSIYSQSIVCIVWWCKCMCTVVGGVDECGVVCLCVS